jgi:hypothetical protein
MIEDDLRGMIAEGMDVDVYARLIPLELPECVVVQQIGGRSSTAGVRRNYRTVTLMAVSTDREKAGQMMRACRNFLTAHIPAEINGTHYYTAVPQADGKLLLKAKNGPRYVTFVDIEVGCSI